MRFLSVFIFGTLPSRHLGTTQPYGVSVSTSRQSPYIIDGAFRPIAIPLFNQLVITSSIAWDLCWVFACPRRAGSAIQIRTGGAFRHYGFQGRCNQPLCHCAIHLRLKSQTHDNFNRFQWYALSLSLPALRYLSRFSNSAALIISRIVPYSVFFQNYFLHQLEVHTHQTL